MKKVCFLFVFVFLTGYVFGQNVFLFNEMSNPDPNKYNLGTVLLLGEQAFAGENISLYYNGNNWLKLNQPISQKTGSMSGIKKENGEVYAFQTAPYGFYSWDNEQKNWKVVVDRPIEMTYVKNFVYEEDNVFLAVISGNYGQIWHYNGDSLEKKTNDYKINYNSLWVKDENNIFLLASENLPEKAKLLHFDGKETLTELYSFSSNDGIPKDIYTVDGQNFFVLTNRGSVYRWNDEEKKMDNIYNYSSSDIYKFGCSIFAIDNNNIIACGNRGIRHINISTGEINVIYKTADAFSFDASSYDPETGHAIFVGLEGKILEMLVSSVAVPKKISASFKTYPNPASDILTIEFPVFGIDQKYLEIYDLSGQLVKTKKFASFKEDVNISDLRSGMYFTKLKDENNKLLSMGKFIKN